MRCWLPIALGFTLLIVSIFVGLILTWILVICAFGFLLDGVTAAWERAGGTGNLSKYQQ